MDNGGGRSLVRLFHITSSHSLAAGGCGQSSSVCSAVPVCLVPKQGGWVWLLMHCPSFGPCVTVKTSGNVAMANGGQFTQSLHLCSTNDTLFSLSLLPSSLCLSLPLYLFLPPPLSLPPPSLSVSPSPGSGTTSSQVQ